MFVIHYLGLGLNNSYKRWAYGRKSQISRVWHFCYVLTFLNFLSPTFALGQKRETIASLSPDSWQHMQLNDIELKIKYLIFNVSLTHLLSICHILLPLTYGTQNYQIPIKVIRKALLERTKRTCRCKQTTGWVWVRIQDVAEHGLLELGRTRRPGLILPWYLSNCTHKLSEIAKILASLILITSSSVLMRLKFIPTRKSDYISLLAINS